MIERQFTTTVYAIKENKVLLLFHPKIKKWLPPGGHLEANETPPEGAKREFKEETGLDIELVSQENIWIDCWNASSFERPYLCLLENIPPYKDVPAHQHIDLIYLGKVTGGEMIKDDSIRWFTLDETERLISDEEIFLETKQTIKHIFEESAVQKIMNSLKE